MQFHVKNKAYPTKWRKFFALLPVKIAEQDGKSFFVWLELYESRDLNPDIGEVRHEGGRMGIDPLSFAYDRET